MTTKKVALFGGSFNPIHDDHIKMANLVLDKKIADEIWIIPSKNHPFAKQLAPAEHRMNMINLAFDNPRIKINTIEIDSDEINYTIRTIKKLKKQYAYEFYWIIGADILHEMNEKWYGLNELLKETEFIIFDRKGYLIKQIPDMEVRAILNIKTKNESSSDIRELVKQKKPLKGLVPLKIEEYIIKNKLYLK
jgi:nicotinate-nucleotide adenylyltransferase